MARCTYCGKDYAHPAIVCVIDRQPVLQVLAPAVDDPELSNPSVEFLRLFFKSPKEQELAVSLAEVLARIVGQRIALLRPGTRFSDILEWSGPSPVHAIILAVALQKEFDLDTKKMLANPQFWTFRDLVEHACSLADKAV
jgi:hypothetical protein